MINVIDCEVKQFGYARRQQQGYQTVYLDNVYKQYELTKLIKREVKRQKNLAHELQLDTQQKRKQLRHGARSKILLKSIEQAWQDIEKKLNKFADTKVKFVNWTEGEIKMFNGVVEIIDQELQQQEGFDPDEYCANALFVLRLRKDGQVICRFPLPEHSIDWTQSHPDFNTIMAKIDHRMKNQPEKCF